MILPLYGLCPRERANAPCVYILVQLCINICGEGDSDGIARFTKSARKGCFSGYVISPDGVTKVDSMYRSADDVSGGFAVIGDSSVFGLRKSPPR